MYLIKDLYDQHKGDLELKLVAGDTGLDRYIEIPEVQRPGLALSGYLENYPTSSRYSQW